MKNYTKFAACLLLAVLVFVPLQSASAKGLSDGQVIFGQSFTLKGGDTLDGDLVVFGGSVTIEEGATVNGQILLFGGNLVVDGEVQGGIALAGGSVTLGAKSHIHGDLSTVGATLERAEGAQIDGRIYNAATAWGINGVAVNPPAVATPPLPAIPNLNIHFNPLGSAADAFGQALGISVLAMLLMLFLAPHADRIAHAIIAQPLTAGGLGLLTLVVAPIAIVLFAVTIILIPAAILAAFALVVVVVFGWIAIGYEIGQRFTKAIHQDWHPAFSAGLGTFALTLIARAMSDIPVLNCVGWLVPFVLGLVAIGAVLMTRFGTQTVLAPAASTAVVPPASPSGENPAR